MTDIAADPTPTMPDDAAERSIEAGIADESAAYEQAIEADESDKDESSADADDRT